MPPAPAGIRQPCCQPSSRSGVSSSPFRVAFQPSLWFSYVVRYEAAPEPTVTSRWSPSQSWIFNWRPEPAARGTVPRVRVTSVSASGPASPASTRWSPAGSSSPRSSPPPRQRVTSIGRRSTRSRTVPRTLVSYSSSSTASTGPFPQASETSRVPDGCGVRYWSRAGTYASVRPTGSCRSSPTTGLCRVSGAVRVTVTSSRSVVIGGKRTQPFSSTSATAAPSGELMCTSAARADRPPAGASTSSPTGCSPSQLRWKVGRSPATHAVVRSPSVRLRADRPAPRRAVESAVATIRLRCSGATSYSSRSSASPGTATARAVTSYVPAAPVVNRRCSPASVPTADNPVGSAARCREITSAVAVDFSASVGSRSSRVTCTSGRSISEKPAPVRPARSAVESTIVSFIQPVAPAGASISCRVPLARRKLVADPFSVSTRTRVAAARTPSCGSGVMPRESGMS